MECQPEAVTTSQGAKLACSGSEALDTGQGWKGDFSCKHK
jgi:hypothetical protein